MITLVKKRELIAKLPLFLSQVKWSDFKQGILDLEHKKLRRRSTEWEFERMNEEESLEEIRLLLKETPIFDRDYYKLTTVSMIRTEEDGIRKQKLISSRGNSDERRQEELGKGFREEEGSTRHFSTIKIYQNNTLVQPNLMIEDLCEDRKEALEPEVLFMMKESLSHYKNLTMLIEEHLKNKDNLFAKMKDAFIEFFAIIHSKNDSLSSNFQIDVFCELKKFVEMLTLIILKFYRCDSYSHVFQKFLFTQGNIRNFLLSVLFEDEKIFKPIYQMNGNKHSQKELQIRRGLSQLSSLHITDFHIPIKYCLTEKTMDFLHRYYRMRSSSSFYTESLCSFSLRRTFSKGKKFEIKMLGEEDTKHLGFTAIECPYMRPIRVFSKISKVTSPIHKLKILMMTAELITKEIANFYRKCGAIVSETLSTDELLEIFIYIISRAKVEHVYNHVSMIQAWTQSQERQGFPGYVLATVRAALEHLAEEGAKLSIDE